MVAEEMTVTRGLAELKLLDARIKKQIQNSMFVDCFQRRGKKETQTLKCLKSGDTVENFEKNTLSNLDSIKALINRRSKIKSAIVKSNAETIVKIGNDEMTVAEAIDRKSSIEYDKLLLTKLKQDYALILNDTERSRVQLESQVQSMLEQNAGADKKADEESYNSLAKPFIEANELNMVDPVKARKLSDEMDEKVDTFISEIDFVLSESNAKTKIEV